MIQFSLSPLSDRPADDPLGRPCMGWREGMSPELVYALNRGCWSLGDVAEDHTIALFASTGDGIVRLAVEIEHPIEEAGEIDGEKKRAIRGRILQAGHPVHDRYVGERAPEKLTVTFRYATAYCGQIEASTGKVCTTAAKWIVTPGGDGHEYIACGHHVTAPLGGSVPFRARPMR